jgi:lysophospholipase L1-like esterase
MVVLVHGVVAPAGAAPRAKLRPPGPLVGGGMPKCKPEVVKGSRAFFSKWKSAARVNQRLLTRDGARFLWVLNPQTSPSLITADINAIYRSVAPGTAGFVDAWTSFGGSRYNPDLHVWDGVHLNQAGQQRLADQVVAAIG